jgi:hypothetical protein
LTVDDVYAQMTNGSAKEVILCAILEQWIVSTGRAYLFIDFDRLHVLLKLACELGYLEQALVCGT